MSDRIVTRESHSRLFEALEIVSHDCGAGAGHPEYAIPEPWASEVDYVEQAMRDLSPEEVETLSIGEHDEARAIASRTPGLMTASDFLEAFFNDFEEE